MEETTKKTGFMEGFKTLAGIQWYLYLLFMVVLVFVMYKGALSTDLMAFIAIASGISIHRCGNQILRFPPGRGTALFIITGLFRRTKRCRY